MAHSSHKKIQNEWKIMKLAAFGFFVALALTAKFARADVPVSVTLHYPIAEGRAEILDSSAKSSCEVFKNRVAYALVRNEQNRKLIDSLKTSSVVFTSEDLSTVKLMLSRMQSKVPGFGDLNRKVTITWDLKAFPEPEFIELANNLATAHKSIQVAELDWETGIGGGVPDNLQIEVDREAKFMKLTYLTNPVDACMGRSDVELMVEVQEGFELDFTAQLPRN